MTESGQSPIDAERAAAWASPTDPNVEYVPAALANRTTCHCHRTVLDDGARSRQLKVLHVDGCTSRVSETGPVADRRPAGVHPCPSCGNVTFTLVPAGRQCHGPTGCGHEFNPATPSVQARQTMAQRLAAQRAA